MTDTDKLRCLNQENDFLTRENKRLREALVTIRDIAQLPSTMREIAQKALAPTQTTNQQ